MKRRMIVLVLVAMVFGVGLGSVLAGIWSGGKVELGILPLGAGIIAISALMLFTVRGELVTSDDHEGIKAAVNRYFQGCCWSRCQFHFIRNILPLAPRGKRKDLHAALRLIFDSPDLATAKARVGETMMKWDAIKTEVAEKIDNEIEDCLACLHFPGPHRKRIRTTNCPERFNQEIKRRTRVVRIFPGRQSAVRLIGAVCMEQSEEWETGRRYLDVDLLKDWSIEADENGEPASVLLAVGRSDGEQ